MEARDAKIAAEQRAAPTPEGGAAVIGSALINTAEALSPGVSTATEGAQGVFGSLLPTRIGDASQREARQRILASSEKQMESAEGIDTLIRTRLDRLAHETGRPVADLLTLARPGKSMVAKILRPAGKIVRPDDLAPGLTEGQEELVGLDPKLKSWFNIRDLHISQAGQLLRDANEAEPVEGTFWHLLRLMGAPPSAVAGVAEAGLTGGDPSTLVAERLREGGGFTDAGGDLAEEVANRLGGDGGNWWYAGAGVGFIADIFTPLPGEATILSKAKKPIQMATESVGASLSDLATAEAAFAKTPLGRHRPETIGLLTDEVRLAASKQIADPELAAKVRLGKAITNEEWNAAVTQGREAEVLRTPSGVDVRMMQKQAMEGLEDIDTPDELMGSTWGKAARDWVTSKFHPDMHLSILGKRITEEARLAVGSTEDLFRAALISGARSETGQMSAAHVKSWQKVVLKTYSDATTPEEASGELFRDFLAALYGGIEDAAPAIRTQSGNIVRGNKFSSPKFAGDMVNILVQHDYIRRAQKSFVRLVAAGSNKEAFDGLWLMMKTLEDAPIAELVRADNGHYPHGILGNSSYFGQGTMLNELASGRGGLPLNFTTIANEDFAKAVSLVSMVRARRTAVRGVIEKYEKRFPFMLASKGELQKLADSEKEPFLVAMLGDSRMTEEAAPAVEEFVRKNYGSLYLSALRAVDAYTMEDTASIFKQVLNTARHEVSSSGNLSPKSEAVVRLAAQLVTDHGLSWRSRNTLEQSIPTTLNWNSVMNTAWASFADESPRGFADFVRSHVGFDPQVSSALLNLTDIEGLTNNKQAMRRVKDLKAELATISDNARGMSGAVQLGWARMLAHLGLLPSPGHTTQGLMVAQGSEALGYVSNLAKSGMTSGLWLPNVSFHVMNALTAPAIMAHTIGAKAAGRATVSLESADVIRTMFGYAKPGVAERVVIRTPDGRVFTNKMLGDIAVKSGVTKSQLSAELTRNVIDDIAAWSGQVKGRELATDFQLAKRLFASPGQRQNVWGQMATTIDNVFRINVMINAIRDGRPIAEATRLGRESLFDYGSMSKWEKKYISRAVYFWTFRRNVYLSTMRSVLDNPGRLSAFGRVINSTHQSPDGEVHSTSDWSHSKPFVSLIDDEELGVRWSRYLPGLPPVEGIEFLVDTMTTLEPAADERLSMVGKGAKIGENLAQIVFGSMNPMVQTVFIQATETEPRKGIGRKLSRELDPSLTSWLAWHPAAWEVFRTIIPLEKVEYDNKRPGRVSAPDLYMDYEPQWRIKEGYQKRYHTLRQLITLAGQERALREYGKLLSPVTGGMDASDPRQGLLEFSGLVKTAKEDTPSAAASRSRKERIRRLE